jgi:hypothetical protein
MVKRTKEAIKRKTAGKRNNESKNKEIRKEKSRKKNQYAEKEKCSRCGGLICMCA